MTVKKISVEKGEPLNLEQLEVSGVDVLVLSFEETIEPEALESVADSANLFYKEHGIPVLVLDGDMGIDYWDEDDLRRMGLKRIDEDRAYTEEDLDKAFQAGADWELYNLRGVGDEDEEPCFKEWIEDYKKTHGHRDDE